MVVMKEGNILNSGADYICHQVNCQGVMNSGVAKAIRQKWPRVYEWYRRAGKDMLSNEFCDEELSWDYMYGHIQEIPVNNNQSVINMFSQLTYGYDGHRYTSYDAFWTCLGEILAQTPKGSKIAFPARIGCVRGGANWNVIFTMIEEVLGADYNVEIWNYDKG